ncbi:MAG TPA: hypothetical protein VH684_05920 [Xanthobacteraceae bacterium]|jgi:hypothetical protein
MFAAECPNCGEPVATFAKGCARCGAPNPARPAGFVVFGSLLLLLAAIAVAIFAVVRWQRVPVGNPEPDATATSADFAWLTQAMKDCDTDAAKAPSTLHFLVIPLAAASADDPQWRNKSLDDVGNAVLLPSNDAVAALKRGALRISDARYIFRVRDDSTKVIFKWSPSTGVKRFSAPDADEIEAFKVQFLSGDKANDDSWGASFTRHKGTCYWVNAILGN